MPITLGGTINLGNYQSLRIEVTGKSYQQAKQLLRKSLLQMLNDFNSTQIKGWWLVTFGDSL